MTEAIFQYAEILTAPDEGHSGGRTVHRPVVPAILTASNGQSLRWLVLPDSGADISLFPLGLALLLKLDISKLQKSSTVGIGGSSTTFHDTLQVNLGSGISFILEAGFTQGSDPLVVGLLGQQGFFSQYDVEFRHSRKEFRVRSIESTPVPPSGLP